MAKGKAVKAGSADAEKIASHIAAAPAAARRMLEEIRALVLATAPKETEEVFSYGMPGFRYKGALLWYGANKAHVGFYPGNPPMILAMAEELKGFKTSKGAIQFPLDKPVPAALVKKIVKLRAAQNEAKKK